MRSRIGSCRRSRSRRRSMMTASVDNVSQKKNFESLRIVRDSIIQDIRQYSAFQEKVSEERRKNEGVFAHFLVISAFHYKVPLCWNGIRDETPNSKWNKLIIRRKKNTKIRLITSSLWSQNISTACINRRYFFHNYNRRLKALLVYPLLSFSHSYSLLRRCFLICEFSKYRHTSSVWVECKAKSSANFATRSLISFFCVWNLLSHHP